MKNYVGIVRDHSGSMSPHRSSAINDYNIVIEGLKSAAEENDIDTIVSVVKCGVGFEAKVVREITFSSVSTLKPIREYKADGSGTPLWDSVGALIDLYVNVPDLNDEATSFLIIVVTDGLENRSKVWTANNLRAKIVNLQGTDRWSFAFRVPRGYARRLSTELNVPMGNILEWETSEQGFRDAAASTVSATRSYFSNLRGGSRSTTRFYSDIADVSPSTIQRELVNISDRVVVWNVGANDPKDIKGFCEKKSKNPYVKGRAYYELVKTETIQDYKEFIIQRRSTGETYAGHAARELLRLPLYGSMRLSPGDHGEYSLFIQSTSLNRVLAPGSKLLYMIKP